MTDITELAPAMKAAANTTADAIDRLKAFPGDELIDLSQHEGEQVDIDITTLNEWYELSSPANVLALVEALEKAQAQSSKWLEAFHKAVSIGARYEERIAELEPRTVKLPDGDERDDLVISITEEIAHLQRCVERYRKEGMASTTQDMEQRLLVQQIALSVLNSAAGIKWEAE